MDWTQTLTIIGVMVGMNAYFFNRIHSDIEGLSKRIDGIERRMDGHASRIDQLYRMFVDMLSHK